MARGLLTVQDVLQTGITPSYTQATVDGTSFPNVGLPILIHIKNTSGSSTVVTFQTPGKAKGETITARTVTVPATSGDKVVSFFPPDVFNQADGTVYIDFSTYAAGVTIAAFLIRE
jgi:hypothetical protein